MKTACHCEEAGQTPVATKQPSPSQRKKIASVPFGTLAMTTLLLLLPTPSFAVCPKYSEDNLRVKLKGAEVLQAAKRPIFTLETEKKVVKSMDLKNFDLNAPHYRWDLVLRSNDIARSCESEADEVEIFVCDDSNGNGSCRDESDRKLLSSPGLRYAYPMLPMDLILRLK